MALTGLYLAFLVLYAAMVTLLCHAVAVTVERRFVPLFLFGSLFGFAGLVLYG